MTALIVETVIIASVTASPKWGDVIVVIMHADTFKITLLFLSVLNVIMHVRHIDSSYIFQYQSQSIDTGAAFPRNYQFKDSFFLSYKINDDLHNNYVLLDVH